MKSIKFTLSLLLINVLIFTSTALIAQDSTRAEEPVKSERSALFPKANDIGVSLVVDGLIDKIQLNSPTNGYGQNLLFARYYYKDDVVFRMGFGFSLDNYNRERSDSSGINLLERDSTYNRYLINVSMGIEKHLRGNKRLDPYVFSQIDLTFIGKTTIETQSNTIKSNGTDRVSRTIKQDGGIAFGLLAGGGFNYFIGERFSLGTELSLKIEVSNVGGAITDNQVTTPVNGSSTTVFTTKNDQVSQTDIDVVPNALINLSYFF